MVIGDKNYIYSTQVRNNDILRKSFNALVKSTFGFSFEEWYNSGGWGDMYIPHVLLDGDKVVSNVSVNIMQFDICGERKNYIQLGTVMTDSSYRGMGLNRYIMENILHEYINKTDGIYLFANDSVLDYYPKFGFMASKEYEYYMPCTGIDDIKPYVIEKTDMSKEHQRSQFYNVIADCQNNTGDLNQNDGMYMDKNLGLYHFWIEAGFGDSIYFIPENGTYIAADVQGKILHIHQVFGKEYIELKRLVKSFGGGAEEILAGYVPACKDGFQAREHKEEDSTLFILGESLQCIENDKMMFPVLSHA